MKIFSGKRGALKNKAMSIWWVKHNTINFVCLSSYNGVFRLILSISTSYTSSVQFSHSVVSNSLWPHEPQHTRPPCPSPTTRVYPNPCPLSRWRHPIISSSVVPFSFSSSPQSFPSSGSFQWVSSLHQMTKLLEFQLQHQCFQSTPRTNLL